MGRAKLALHKECALRAMPMDERTGPGVRDQVFACEKLGIRKLARGEGSLGPLSGLSARDRVFEP
eukprot:6213615-Pleurochrysis_carterae.AAC.4